MSMDQVDVAELRDRVERCDEADLLWAFTWVGNRREEDALRMFAWLVQEYPDAAREALDETGAP